MLGKISNNDNFIITINEYFILSDLNARGFSHRNANKESNNDDRTGPFESPRERTATRAERRRLSVDDDEEAGNSLIIALDSLGLFSKFIDFLFLVRVQISFS